MTTAMHGRADTSADGGSGEEQVIDLSTHGSPPVTTPTAPSLYGPRPDEAPIPAQAQEQAIPATPAAAVDAEALARMAAEVAVSVERHRQELAAAMAELTALQRTLRSEVRSVIAELDRIAEGVAPAEATSAALMSDAVPDPSATADARSSRWSVPSRLHRAH